MSTRHRKILKRPTMAGQLSRDYVRISNPEQVDAIYNLFKAHKKALYGNKMYVLYILPEGDEIVCIYGSNDIKEETFAKVTRLYPSKLSRHRTKQELWKKFRNRSYTEYLQNLQEHGEYKQAAFK